MPVLVNLFGTPNRVALGMGEESVEALREVGKLLAYLKEPEPPKGFRDAWDKWPVLKQVLNMSPRVLSQRTLPEQSYRRQARSILRVCRFRPAGRVMRHH